MKVLILFILAVYGWSWLLTKSQLLRPTRIRVDTWLLNEREKLRRPDGFYDMSLKRSFLEKLHYLVNCIVCTAGWVTIPIGLATQHSVLFDHTSMVSSPIDLILLIGIALSSTWFIAYNIGDAD